MVNNFLFKKHWINLQRYRSSGAVLNKERKSFGESQISLQKKSRVKARLY